MSTAFKPITGVDRSMEGGRILWRHFLSMRAPAEGWVREFTADGARVRISKTDKSSDAGTWHRCYDLVVEAVLEAARAPSAAQPPDVAGFVDFSGGGE